MKTPVSSFFKKHALLLISLILLATCSITYGLFLKYKENNTVQYSPTQQELQKQFSDTGILFSELNLQLNSDKTKYDDSFDVDAPYISFSTTSESSELKITQKQDFQGYTVEILQNKNTAKPVVLTSLATSTGKIISVQRIEYHDSVQYILYDWNGAVGCCFTAIPVKLDTGKQIIGTPYYIGESEKIPGIQNFFEIDGTIYFHIKRTLSATEIEESNPPSKNLLPILIKFKDGKFTQV